ncbi:hypothetical protein NESM_000090800 [Novymonas esmeraldas]|uniref:Uncharacterized protein n=1 Tax=Novymonas esmeraldas TaxID=1808958 RepID=A0AAW0F2G0_9TRYP
MQYEKPGGAIHEVIRRAFDELRLHNNAQGAITIVTYAFANAESLPLLKSGKDLNGGTPQSTPRSSAASPRSGGDGGAAGVGSSRSGGLNGVDDGTLRPRLGGSSSVTRATQAAAMQWFTAGTVGTPMSPPPPPIPAPPPQPSVNASALPAGSSEWLNKQHRFNVTQVLRLLLIRCEAYSSMKQHSRALHDALNAVEVSQGQSAEAYFAVGREQRRQFNIPESASAFDTAEALLHSMQQAIAAGKNVVDGWSQDTVSEEDFWAERGYHMSEVRELGITRREYELQERSGYRASLSNPGSALSSPLGHGHTDATSPLTGGSAGRGGYARGFESSFPGAGHTPPPLLHVEPSHSQNGSAVNRSFGGDSAGATGDGAGSSTYVRDLLQCGMSPNELAMWRRLANESRALLLMRQSHTVPSTVLAPTMTLLDRRINGTRGGLILSIENNSSVPLRFVGAHAPDGAYHDGFSFPDTVAKAHCAVSLLHPRGWGGYSGCVCYEVHEHLSCFFYFDCPLLASHKYGVRFVEHRAADLRRAFAEIYKEAGVYGIEGGTTASALATPPLSSTAGAAGGVNGGRVGAGGVSIRGATTPLTTTVAGMTAARAAVRVPPSSTWIPSHAAISASRRPIKAVARMNGSQGIAFSLSEVLAVKLRSVELVPALEYVGATALKKLSSVSQRYRELVNNLPPTLFYGAGRRSYPDYCAAADRFSSPWVVRDVRPVTWKLIFDGRLADQEEFSISDESDGQKHILCFSADAQNKVTGYVYFGDKRCLQYIIKESWVPFSNTLYITTPVGRTVAHCTAMNNQTQFTLSLASGGGGGGGGAGGGGGGGGGGGSAAKGGGEDVFYTARKRVPPAGEPTTPVPNALAGHDAGAGQRSRSSPAAVALGTTSGVVTGVVESVGGVDAGGTTAAARRAAAAPVASTTPLKRGGSSSGLSVLSMPMTAGGIAQATLYSPIPSGIHAPGPPPSEAGQSSVAPTNAATAAATTTTVSCKPDHYSIWRSQRVSGGAVVGSVAPTTTNGGADIVAEVKVNPVLYGTVAKGYCAAEVMLYPGADAMLVSIMSFLMTRW